MCQTICEFVNTHKRRGIQAYCAFLVSLLAPFPLRFQRRRAVRDVSNDLPMGNTHVRVISLSKRATLSLPVLPPLKVQTYRPVRDASADFVESNRRERVHVWGKCIHCDVGCSSTDSPLSLVFMMTRRDILVLGAVCATHFLISKPRRGGYVGFVHF